MVRTLALLIGVWAVLGAAPAFAQAPPGAVRAALEQELERGYQRALPEETELPESAGGTGTGNRPPPQRLERPAAPRLGGALASGVTLLLWVLAAVVFGLMMWLVVLAVRGRDPGRVEVDPGTAKDLPAVGEAADPPVQVSTQPRLDADALAAQGRYAEAIHVLLLRTLTELAAHRAAPLPIAATSRGLLRESRLAGAAKQAFAVLVRATELTRFGGRPAGAEHYANCVEHFEQFRRSLQR